MTATQLNNGLRAFTVMGSVAATGIFSNWSFIGSRLTEALFQCRKQAGIAEFRYDALTETQAPRAFQDGGVGRE
jgi:hypothetical protein